MESNARAGFVAGVGASAGGLESLEQFFRAMPADTGLAFVVVQHLSPDHKSLMEELFTRFTRIPVREAKHHERVLPNHIYLLPPGKELEIAEGRLEVTDRQQDRHLSFPIDRFLTSLAADCGQRAIAVILSGSGSDGSRGVRRVQSQGGLVLVEDPQIASFDGMPRAAIDTGAVDAVMDAEGLARTLVEHVTSGELPQGESARVVEEVIDLLRARKRIDFDDYKRSTVYRRVLRRARLSGAQDLADYARLVNQDEGELSALHFDLLIGVTNFFRDEGGFNVLARQIDELVLSPVEPDRELRAWVAGCASGEEAFSVAIMLDDAIRKAGSKRGYKVFATDIHDGALESAGAGVFAPARIKGLSEERLATHFKLRPDGQYQVNPELRHKIVFAKHNLLCDTPFTNLDLVTCRNMLIYLRPQAQRRSLASLCYGLRIGGLLFLGSSETPGELQSCFDTVSESAKVYRKRVHGRGMQRPDIPTRVAMRGSRDSAVSTPAARLLPTYDALLERFMPPGFLVGEQRALLECFNGAEALLQVPARRASADFLDLVPTPVRLAVAGALARAAREAGPVAYSSLEWPAPSGNRYFALTAERMSIKGAEASFLVTLAEHSAEARPVAAAATDMPLGSDRVLTLEDELTRTRENLQATVEELEASNEELQATNEEMVASNEELQSVNEELHSVNEELHTVNAEHQRKISELSEVNRDIGHLLESIDVATIYLDGGLRIRKYTPLAASIFSLVEHDTGRLLESFNHPLLYPALMDDVRRVRDGEGRVEQEVQSRDGRWYLLRLLPYRISGAIDGVVVTLTDASALAAARIRARQLSAIVDSSADAIIGQDLDGTIRSWNAGAVRLYGYEGEQVIGQPAMILVPEPERATTARMLEEVARGGDAINVAAQRRSKAGEALEVAVTVSPVRDAAGTVTGIASIDRDVRAQKELERRLRESERKYEDLYDNAPDMYMSVDSRSGRIVEQNTTFRKVTGFEPGEVEAMHALDLFAPGTQDAARQALASMRSGVPVNDLGLRIRRKDGSELEVTLSSTAVVDPAGNAVRSRTIMRDVTERKLAEQQVAEMGAMREQFLAMVSHELRSPLHATNAALQIIDSPNANDAQRTRSEAVVRRQTKQMVRLVDDLLDVSRIIHGKLVLERAPIDLVEVARAALEAAVSAFGDTGVVLLTEGLEQGMPAVGDASRLAQVFGNLLQNAVRYTPEGRRVLLRATRDESSAKFEVIDEGRGIEAGDLDAIFQMFVQSRQGLARTEGGLGLGLTIAERIVTAHGGTIVAASRGLGQGATFTVTLPLSATAARRTHGDGNQGRPLSIVVVEDQTDARESLAMILELDGHSVASAADGEEGLELILARRPEVALLDIGLPGMNGFDVASRAREALGRSITLIAMSGYGQPEVVRRAEAAGFDRHLTKPMDSKRLASALREIHWRETFAGPTLGVRIDGPQA